MQTVTYQHLVDLFAATSPVTLSNGTLNAEDATTFNRYVNRALVRGWEWIFWPATMAYEERHFRDSWTATSWPSGAEVWHAATATYYRANATTTGTDVPGASSKWDSISSALDAYVAYEQTGASAFSRVQEVWNADHRTAWPAYRLGWEYDNRGIRLTGRTAPPSVWLYFQNRPTGWRGAVWSGSATYAVDAVKYFAGGTDTYEGDFWTCLAATSAGESPATAPAKWRCNAVPAFLGDFAVAAASLGFREGQSKLDAALLAKDSAVWSWLYDEKAKLSGGLLRTAAVANLPP